MPRFSPMFCSYYEEDCHHPATSFAFLMNSMYQALVTSSMSIVAGFVSLNIVPSVMENYGPFCMITFFSLLLMLFAFKKKQTAANSSFYQMIKSPRNAKNSSRVVRIMLIRCFGNENLSSSLLIHNSSMTIYIQLDGKS